MKGRSYDDGCAMAHALDLIGERWALLIARELMFGPKRFTDLREELRSISPNVLTQRLEGLEASAILRRRKLPPPAASWIYELTEWGRELEEPILSLGRWAARSPFLRPDLPMTRAGLLLALRAMYRPRKAGGFRILLDMPRGGAVVAGTHKGLDILQDVSVAGAHDASITASSDIVDGIVFGSRTLLDAVAAGDAQVDGDPGALQRFVKAFPLPETAAAD
ncbi:winged helix-turn-helix transcriptional regulator [Stappia sp. MMSF_3263]|uniref:winged helix-turn-helix transcriptional regulator n=1 Tax=Stappia sp. MMSF_3263 TaxID=3046693 RepID=UPI00273D6B88|nr:winged helix-turn-helix transcriptional regulator [Stappia sp. MMSF_3263]